MNLYQISKEAEESLIRLGEMLENGETPSDEEVNDLLDLRGDLHDKLLNYGKFIKNNSSDIDALDGEIRRLSAKKRALNNLNECLKSNMLAAMQANDIKKVDDPIIPIRSKKAFLVCALISMRIACQKNSKRWRSKPIMWPLPKP
nr:siphovirus Gp157 family protein [Moraxella catarrhalis]